MLGLGSVELVMCGRVIQKSGPLRLAIVEGLDVSDSRMGNIPPRYNAAPSQELLVIRHNHKTGERSLDLIKWGPTPYWCKDPRGGRKPIWLCCGIFDRPTTLSCSPNTASGLATPHHAGHWTSVNSAICLLGADHGRELVEPRLRKGGFELTTKLGRNR